MTVSDAAIGAAAREAQERWPGVSLPFALFASHVRRLAVDGKDLRRNGADLYLACACGHRSQAALGALEAQVVPQIERYLRRFGQTPSEVDEVRQQLLILMLTGEPRILRYSGRGSLVGWLRTVARRILGRQIEGELVDPGDGELLADVARGPADPELEVARSRLGPTFQRALEETLAALPPRSRTILRLHYGDGLNIDAIGSVFHVHRATVARWLVNIRATVIAGVRDRLALGARPTSSEFRSVAHALAAELHVSIERLLR
jgi:RNA polymerase sigma-70 factor, ECF subfamily